LASILQFYGRPIQIQYIPMMWKRTNHRQCVFLHIRD
jgi:hypothetical protein